MSVERQKLSLQVHNKVYVLQFLFYSNCFEQLQALMGWIVLKFIYSETATKFFEIFPLLLSVYTVDKSKGKISQNFVAFSEYMNFIYVV